MLAIEVELLIGVSVAARPQSHDETEWPPHPDRLFQALVAAWARSEPPSTAERAALEWLESLPGHSLVVRASEASLRSVATVFVPPNDAVTTNSALMPTPSTLRERLVVLPEQRRNRQPRNFPAAVPVCATVVYAWGQTEEAAKHLAALDRLAREMTYLGHSHTPVRARALTELPADSPPPWEPPEGGALRLPFPGRLSQLVRSYTRDQRPLPSPALRRFASPGRSAAQTSFSSRDIVVLGDDGGCIAPALEAFPLVAKRLRDTLMKTADDGSLRVSPTLSGHDDSGAPAISPHLAFAPLADVGWDHSIGRLMGIALVWPRDVEPSDRRDDLLALAAFMEQSGKLNFGRLGQWKLTLDVPEGLSSLSPSRYVRQAREWRTVLPLALDRHPKANGPDAAQIVARACLNNGLPASALEGIGVELGGYPALKGAPGAKAVREALPPDSPYRGRPLLHASIRFSAAISGPLLLGAGRYRGLGFCMAVPEDREHS